eukprot:gene2019-2296_t
MAALTTPVKVTRTVTSDSCKRYCAICAEDIQLKYKNPKDLTINLWKNDNKTDHCRVVEDFLAKSFSRDSDFRVVCKSCFRAAQNFRKARDQKVLQLESTRKEIVPLHLSKRVKRGVSSEMEADDVQGACGRPKSRRKIEVGGDANSEGVVMNPFHSFPTASITHISQQSSIKVIVTEKSGMVLHAVISDDHKSLVRGIIANDPSVIAECAFRNSEIRDKIINCVAKEISKECCKISTSNPSSFKFVENTDLLKEVTPTKQQQELSQKAPILYTCLEAASYNAKALARNTTKSKESILPAIMTAASILLHCYSIRMNMNIHLLSLVLRRGGADKACFKRLNRAGICLSYPHALKSQGIFGKDNADMVKGWWEPLPQNCSTLPVTNVSRNPQQEVSQYSAQIPSILSDTEIAALNESFHELDITEMESVEKSFQTEIFSGDSDSLDEFIDIQLLTSESDTPGVIEKPALQTPNYADVNFSLAGDNVNLSKISRKTAKHDQKK